MARLRPRAPSPEPVAETISPSALAELRARLLEDEPAQPDWYAPELEPIAPEPEPVDETIRLVAHRNPTFPESFKIITDRDGFLLALGRDPLRAALARLREEDLLPPGGRVVLRFADGTPEALEHVEP